MNVLFRKKKKKKKLKKKTYTFKKYKPYILFVSDLSSPSFRDFRIRAFKFRFIGFVFLNIDLRHPTDETISIVGSQSMGALA